MSVIGHVTRTVHISFFLTLVPWPRNWPANTCQGYKVFSENLQRHKTWTNSHIHIQTWFAQRQILEPPFASSTTCRWRQWELMLVTFYWYRHGNKFWTKRAGVGTARWKCSQWWSTWLTHEWSKEVPCRNRRLDCPKSVIRHAWFGCKPDLDSSWLFAGRHSTHAYP